MKRLPLTLASAIWAATVLVGCTRSGPPKPVEIAQVNKTPEAQEPGDLMTKFMSMQIGDDAKPNPDPEMLAGVITGIDEKPWAPKAAGFTRGNDDPTGPKVYSDVAPSVVVVKTRTGHGTGSIVNEKGWVLTNHHVIAKAAVDQNGNKVATIYTGKINAEGTMELDDQGLPAVVVASTKEKDMALLHIKNATQKFPAIKIAAKVPAAQFRCYAIGHPASGLLWSVRDGKIAQIGLWPRDGATMLARRVSASPSDVEAMSRTMAKSAQMKIVLSTCGINVGDSGGPLVNSDGELISVTFAMPEDAGTTSFGYHIHLEEVKKFLAANDALQPSAPAPEAIDPWPAGAYLELIDLDGDGIPDAMGIANAKGGALTGLMLDLRNENKVKTLADLGDSPKKWRFNLAIHFRPQPMAFYDTQMNGTIDLVMAEKEPGGSIQIKRLEKGQWTTEDGGRRPLFDPILFPDRAVRDRLTLFTKKLQEK